MIKPVWSHVLALSVWALKKAHTVKLLESMSPDYKNLHARQISHQPSFPSEAIPDCIRYIIGVFCYNFKSQTNIHINTLACVKAKYSPCSAIYTSHTLYITQA